MSTIQEIDKGLVKELIIGELKGKHFIIVITLLKKLGLDIKKISSVIKKMQKMSTDAKKENPKADQEKLKEIVEDKWVGLVDELIEVFYDEVLCKLPVIESDIKKILTSITNYSEEELDELPMQEYIGTILKVAKSEGFTGIFKSMT